MKSYFFKFIICSICISGFAFSQNLHNSKWILVSIDNLETGKSKLTESLVVSKLYFNGDTTFSGVACNFFTGNFKVTENNLLRMSMPTGTKKFCLAISELEKELFTLYSKASRYKLAQNSLFIFTSDEKRLEFKKE